MLKSSLCNYSDTNMLVKGTTSVENSADAGENNLTVNVIFKNCASFEKIITKIGSTQVDNVQDIDVMMPKYNLLEYSNNCSKTSRSSFQCCR